MPTVTRLALSKVEGRCDHLRGFWVFALLLMLLGAPAKLLMAQRVTTIEETALCGSCDLVVKPVLQLGDVRGPGIIEHSEARVARDRSGNMYVVGPYETRVKVFAPDGKYLRSIGTKGAGPGEYEGIAKVWVSREDSLYIFDNMLRRYDVLGPDGTLVRSARLEVGPEMQTIVLPSGEFVFGLPIRTPDRIGQPLHRLTSIGKVMNSFGSATGVFRPDVPSLDRRVIAPVGGSVIWSAYHNQYVLEMLDALTGRILWEVRRDAPWFPSRMRPTTGQTGEPKAPEPAIVDVRQDARGQLLVLILVPDRDWRKAVSQGAAEGHIAISNSHEYYDTVLEVLNPGLGIIVGSHRFDEYVTHFIDDSTVGTVIESNDGTPIVQLWGISFIQH